MRLSDVVQDLEARVVTHPTRMDDIQIERVSAADKMSDLLQQASSATLLVSHLSNHHLLRIADLLDVPCICLLDGEQPSATLLQLANETGTILMVSPQGMDETCRRLERRGLPRTGGSGR